ncbi:hypothetical protein Hanom_Chr11g01033391 [Helianthus anomalus]
MLLLLAIMWVMWKSRNEWVFSKKQLDSYGSELSKNEYTWLGGTGSTQSVII